MRTPLPERALTFMILRRGVILWLLVRLMLMLLALAVAGGLTTAIPLTLSPVTAIGIVVIVTALGLVESRRVNESALLSNLGISPLVRMLLALTPALLGEVVVVLLAAS